jgi:hypothetical protein
MGERHGGLYRNRGKNLMALTFGWILRENIFPESGVKHKNVMGKMVFVVPRSIRNVFRSLMRLMQSVFLSMHSTKKITGVSEECTAYIFRIREQSKQYTCQKQVAT